MADKLWGGRFEGKTHPDVELFTASLSIDKRLAESDLLASCAHVASLEKAGVLRAEESAQLVSGLLSLQEDLKKGTLAWDPEAEDIHSEIERLLTLRVGGVAAKVHTGRSRNDQVATATRLYVRESVDELISELRALQVWLVKTAEGHLETLLPGLTHLQHAQPVSLAHHLMAYFWMFERDKERLQEARKRINTLPLGAAALAGTPFSIDREWVKAELGFERICENSLDAVSDRDFVVEALGHLSLVMVHLSRLSEELIRWSTPELGFVELSDAVTTGSSLMPQKKNPDVAELIRGRIGRVVGGLTGALILLKGLPLSYNRDLQEDKHHLFEGLDTTRASVRLMTLMLESTRFVPVAMRKAIEGDFSNATDLADYLVRKGVAFREAHATVGRAVRECLAKGQRLESLALSELKTFCPLIEEDIYFALTPEAGVSARAARGGTAPSAVALQISLAKDLL